MVNVSIHDSSTEHTRRLIGETVIIGRVNPGRDGHTAIAGTYAFGKPLPDEGFIDAAVALVKSAAINKIKDATEDEGALREKIALMLGKIAEGVDAAADDVLTGTLSEPRVMASGEETL